MGKIFSDDVSELYRKYIIKIKISTKEFYYVLWGTNLAYDDNDYLLLNTQKQIVGFSKIKDLLRYVKQPENVLLDKLNTEKWGSIYNGRRAYTTYNIGELFNLLTDLEKNVFIADKDVVSEIVHFCSLFSDYAYQVDKRDFIKLYEDKNLCILIDWINAKFLWNSDEAYLSQLDYKLKNIDFQSIKEIIKKMCHYFNEHIIILSYPNVECIK